MKKFYKVDGDVFEQLLAYLSDRPWKEVASGMAGLMNSEIIHEENNSEKEEKDGTSA